ncbi:MAG: hypothetical protein GY821_16450 [Gammaproteobacteria bacterium]|nr:hypothetical protein [Gammaproteobacteria bacterium]
MISTEQVIEGPLGELTFDNNQAELSFNFNILINPTIDVTAATTKVTETETDAALAVNLTDSLRNTRVTDIDESEVFTSMELTINNFPAGATISGSAVISSSAVAGVLTAQLNADILQSDANAVIVTFPEDYSTQTPQPEGYLGTP